MDFRVLTHCLPCALLRQAVQELFDASDDMRRKSFDQIKRYKSQRGERPLLKQFASHLNSGRDNKWRMAAAAAVKKAGSAPSDMLIDIGRPPVTPAVSTHNENGVNPEDGSKNSDQHPHQAPQQQYDACKPRTPMTFPNSIEGYVTMVSAPDISLALHMYAGVLSLGASRMSGPGAL